jgi:hypothetical protein
MRDEDEVRAEIATARAEIVAHYIKIRELEARIATLVTELPAEDE